MISAAAPKASQTARSAESPWSRTRRLASAIRSGSVAIAAVASSSSPAAPAALIRLRSCSAACAAARRAVDGGRSFDCWDAGHRVRLDGWIGHTQLPGRPPAPNSLRRRGLQTVLLTRAVEVRLDPRRRRVQLTKTVSHQVKDAIDPCACVGTVGFDPEHVTDPGTE